MISKIADLAISKASPGMLAAISNKTPRALLDWKARESFCEVVRYAYRHSRFYRQKFDSLNINPDKVRKPSDLGGFYTTPQDIVEHAEDFLCRQPHMVFESSGTTGRNKRIYVSMDELGHIGKFNAAGMLIGGVRKTDRIVNAFDFCIWIPGMIGQKSLEHSGMLGMAAGKVDPMEVYKRIPTYNFNVVLGEPTWLIRLTEIAEKSGSYPLKFIIGGAEEMPDAARPWMEKVWPGVEVRMVYASVESAGIMAFEAFRKCAGGYHIDENNFLVEITDPDAEGYGEVTFTTLARRTMPLIRYRNRDISRIIEERCPCGLPYRKLARMRGRSDELVVASGGNIYPLMFQEILKDVDGITSEWQIVLKLNDIKEVMEFNLELKEGRSAEDVKRKIFSNIKSHYPDLWKNMEIAIFETSFVYHKPGEVRTGRKLLRLVDRRYVKQECHGE
ncbi:MAG: phenylacetate--CoA ligase family protein [Candidatus Omnitrophica bacterium]|nr:phenylacetate--CoA ligase family protein [Candidatus Omnitrophota bacterium]